MLPVLVVVPLGTHGNTLIDASTRKINWSYVNDRVVNM